MFLNNYTFHAEPLQQRTPMHITYQGVLKTRPVTHVNYPFSRDRQAWMCRNMTLQATTTCQIPINEYCDQFDNLMNMVIHGPFELANHNHRSCMGSITLAISRVQQPKSTRPAMTHAW